MLVFVVAAGAVVLDDVVNVADGEVGDAAVARFDDGRAIRGIGEGCGKAVAVNTSS